MPSVVVEDMSSVAAEEMSGFAAEEMSSVATEDVSSVAAEGVSSMKAEDSFFCSQGRVLPSEARLVCKLVTSCLYKGDRTSP